MTTRQPEEEICTALADMGIQFTHFAHTAAITQQDNLRNDQKFGFHASYCKNLFLCDKRQTQFYLLLLPFEKRFKASDISHQIGSTRLEFAPDDKLYEFMRCTPGAVSALGLLFDPSHRVQLLADEVFLQAESVCFHPNVNTSTIVMKTEDFTGKFLLQTGHPPIIVHAPAE